MNKPEDRVITFEQLQIIIKQLQKLPFEQVHTTINILLSLKGISDQDKVNKVNNKNN